MSPLYSHLKELKIRLIVSISALVLCSLVSYVFAENIYTYLMKPLQYVVEKEQQRRFIFTNLTEVFFSYVKLSVFAGFVISFPIIASQIYLFIAPALYKEEKKIFIPFLIFSPLLFIIGIIFAYLIVLPAAWKFLISFEQLPKGEAVGMPIIFEAKVSEYLSLAINLVTAFGVAFQLPIILLLLAKFTIIDTKWLRTKRKIAIIVIFIVAAILTPPDVVSQIILAIPMMLLYELSLFLCKYIEKT